MNIWHKLEVRKFISFVVTGGVAAVVNLLSRYCLSWIMSYELALVFAYIIGMTTAFVLARKFVFRPSGRSRVHEYHRFALVNLAAFAQVWLVSVALARWALPALSVTWHVEEVAHFVGVISPVLISFYAHKNYSFKEANASIPENRS